MDYEKKYNEALGRAKSLFGNCPVDSERSKTASIIFPELKESEDEQHRKWILEYLYDGLRKSDEQFKDQFKCAISWLEKQGEQKPAEWSEEDKDKLNHILEIVHIAPGREVSVDEKEELESFLKSLRPQPKQEWSKEYERIRKDIERFLKQHNGWSKENKEMMWNDLLQRI